ncbi:LOW QUALITY PROTEIN: cytokinin dehydrogenase 3-like [Asparagus officinalis]|uniref:LOW QUALITY PROTEIN: cytokinin dehydrogenase 3-like n=1 Tax=Asparagus officinalis TaxID=4686 RepID=UPI00098DE42A|nr:LOW QUALITY PROTEIN: cytokinin dehydrogenase 3-like [Asparagus officinalis]
MELTQFCPRLNFFLLLLLAPCSPCNFIQSPMDFGPLNLSQTTSKASVDFGRIRFNNPSAVLRPAESRGHLPPPRLLSSSPSSSGGVAVAGEGRPATPSTAEAQAPDGIVVDMGSLPCRGGRLSSSGPSADVTAEALWSELLEESLKSGLAPRSWTDYLHLTVGGTLSNAGISGQSFKFGPQISNVLQLDVVTGNGELVTCSPTESSELFHAVLGGLGQFGIITRARITLQKAPEKVKWVRAFYDDFDKFSEDQELLISMPEEVDYVEGFVVLNEQSLHSSSVAFPSQLDFVAVLERDASRVYYCIEFAVHDYQQGLKPSNVDQVVEEVSRKMSYMPRYFYSAEVSYFDFINRVTMEELSLRRRGLWDVPHPWLNLFVPKSGITKFKDLLLGSISPKEFEGPLLIYPLLRDKWNANSSAVLPESGKFDRVVYVVGILRSANPNTCSPACLQDLLRRNRHIAEVASRPNIGAKQYLAHHPSPAHWPKWDRFATHKTRFDPLNILAPGQGIFPKSYLTTQDTSYSL